MSVAPLPRTYTCTEIADHLRVDVDTVRAWIKTGELGAFNAGNSQIKPRWRIDADSLEAFKRRRMATGPTPRPKNRKQVAGKDYIKLFPE